ncbi:GNAT family N-acetyltransferase [Pseudomonas sp. MAG002Y]|uniref:GNAT family N-acetyltransferase n=1 Tax=Pseudomonas sp. MAG002Y TaxID=2678690 RepID=UPI001C609E23|nr:GNAT family N-acetyltransferase [Pseudomonas sp. MAG002Y]MBW5412564.1 GNAT family N-acetyltransferase [Pseudomonas sp. MAG002Y]
MSSLPLLKTHRLQLRPYVPADAPFHYLLADNPDIASMTGTLPSPYTLELAKHWISNHERWFMEGRSLNLAVVLQEHAALIGTISLSGFGSPHRKAGLAYWIGKAYWNQGYCSEAARVVIEYGFTTLGLNRIFGECFKRNRASIRVLEKLGMSYEGCRREDMHKAEQFEDVMMYGLLRKEWKQTAV